MGINAIDFPVQVSGWFKTCGGSHDVDQSHVVCSRRIYVLVTLCEFGLNGHKNPDFVCDGSIKYSLLRT